MSAERPELDPMGERDELLYLAFDQEAAGRGEKHALARNPRIQAELDQMRELASELAEALRPEALPEAVQRLIELRVAQSISVRRWSRPRVIRIAGLAAAAALAFAAVGRWVVWPARTLAPEPITITSADAAEIVDAYGLLGWSHVEYSLERTAEELENVAKLIETTGQGSGLPWGQDNDWDVPRNDKKTEIEKQPPIACDQGACIGGQS